ncbi:hypothetical protein AALP_AA8G064200 [Arabis alpina]|uniref:Leucine-rich repeat-containing N-terminal plant-type domain-containing protein n=1 Tax=Arabis alpina TaxID=50452 RepID=A0A087G5D6_ARAAL|nr:hypothetical protein AALP_AA8G064200 [Arabis alpina]
MDKTKTLLFFLFLFTLLLTTSFSKNLCHKDDKKALLKIKRSLNNPYSLSTWDPSTDCCSSWSGVHCGDDFKYRVTGLFINSDDKLSGHISPEVGDLTYLENLVFQYLPNLTGKIPPTIAKLKYLVLLWVQSTNVAGPVPGFLSQLKNLQFLDLSNNKFSGSIPTSLSLLPNLLSLNLKGNKLTGSIPESFQRKVLYLDLSHNHLSGSIPKSLGKLHFYSIDLSWNKLEGDASMLFGANKTTYDIDLSRNKFQFNLSRVKIPSTLDHLDLNHNRITGNISAQWTEVPLSVFNVSYNKLCGRIPNGGNLQKFDSSSYFHNKCLCGAPLKSCK